MPTAIGRSRGSSLLISTIVMLGSMSGRMAPSSRARFTISAPAFVSESRWAVVAGRSRFLNCSLMIQWPDWNAINSTREALQGLSDGVLHPVSAPYGWRSP